MYEPKFKVGDIILSRMGIRLKVERFYIADYNHPRYDLLYLDNNHVTAYSASATDTVCMLDYTYKALMEFDEDLSELVGEESGENTK